MSKLQRNFCLLPGGRAVVPTGWDIRLPSTAFGESHASEFVRSRRLGVINAYTNEGYADCLEVVLVNDTNEDITLLERAPLIVFSVLQYMSLDYAVVRGSLNAPIYEEIPDSTQNI